MSVREWVLAILVFLGLIVLSPILVPICVIYILTHGDDWYA